VNTDGLISFVARINGSMYTPRLLPIRSATPFIAPYWADVDSRKGNGRIYYRQATGIGPVSIIFNITVKLDLHGARIHIPLQHKRVVINVSQIMVYGISLSYTLSK